MQLTAAQRIAAADAARPLISVQPPPHPKQAPRIRRCVTANAEQGDSVNGAAASSANPLEFNELTDIIRMVNATDIVELELKSKRFSLAMRKKEAIAVPEPPQIQYMQAPAPAQQTAPQQAAPAPPMMGSPMPMSAPPPAAAPAAEVFDGVEVLSPMGGTYYRSPAPGEPPFIREGDKVKKGQTICIIEAMKLMNEIEAEVGGTVTKLIVDNGTPVTPGQALLVIKP